jgi:hypothetical protein
MAAQGLAAHVEDEQKDELGELDAAVGLVTASKLGDVTASKLGDVTASKLGDELGELDAAVEVLSLLAVASTHAHILTPEALHRVGGDR